MDAIPIIVMAAVAVFAFGLFYWSQRYRAASIRALAARVGFHYLGNAVPRSLTLGDTPFADSSSIWNLIDGEPNGVRIIAFDCRVGMGRQSWRRTVIAVSGSSDILSTVRFSKGIVVNRSGDWNIVYRPKGHIGFSSLGLMSVDELEAYLQAIRH
jgi:hypothetical protein